MKESVPACMKPRSDPGRAVLPSCRTLYSRTDSTNERGFIIDVTFDVIGTQARARTEIRRVARYNGLVPAGAE
jgi:hypothetical protein